MIPAAVHILDRPDGGVRACAATVPGCVVIHKDRNHAGTMCKIAVAALIEEQLNKENPNALFN